jgi:hypothetical protein
VDKVCVPQEQPRRRGFGAACGDRPPDPRIRIPQQPISPLAEGLETAKCRCQDLTYAQIHETPQCGATAWGHECKSLISLKIGFHALAVQSQPKPHGSRAGGRIMRVFQQSYPQAGGLGALATENKALAVKVKVFWSLRR